MDRSGSVGVGERPAEAGELAGDGHSDERAALAAAVRSLARFDPTVVRRAVPAAGCHHLHVGLIDLGRFLRPGVEVSCGALRSARSARWRAGDYAAGSVSIAALASGRVIT
jgi:hypothetical protein